MTINKELNDFLKSSLSLIDDQDLNREMNNTQLKYAKDMLRTDLEIAELDSNIKKINFNSDKLNENTKDIKNKFKLIKEELI